jgi:hypothetical protein
MEVFFPFILGKFPFTLYRKRLVFHPDIEVFLADARYLQLQQKLMGIFIDIDRGHKVASGKGFGLHAVRWHSEVVED